MAIPPDALLANTPENVAVIKMWWAMGFELLNRHERRADKDSLKIWKPTEALRTYGEPKSTCYYIIKRDEHGRPAHR